MKKTNSCLLVALTFSMVVTASLTFIKAQDLNTGRYQYLSPAPGAIVVMPSTYILIRYGESFSLSITGNQSDIIVTGEKSGHHTGEIILLEKNKILSFHPTSPFEYGEKVTVELNNIKLLDTGYAPDLKYAFTVTNKKTNYNGDPKSVIISELSGNKNHKTVPESGKILQDSLPPDFPMYTVNNDNPTPGYLFFAPFIWPFTNSIYLIISDNYGIPVFYRKMTSTVFDFQKQINGDLTYFDTGTGLYCEMDNKYQVINTYSMQNGYATDIHELRILPDGHAMMFAYDPEPVRMDTIVAGGDPDAIVTGLILQELDENKNLIFQWRSWDHFKITDATEDIVLTDSLIDYVHGNAIEIDYDNNILISCRHMDEITKINRTTGNIIWRWGGVHCKNNQFIFLNDSIGFSHQHCIRRLPNGNYMIFDNGNLHNPQFSRAVEYQMDEVNRIVTLVWENRNNPVTYTDAMGSVERLSNHNTVIGWGSNSAPLDITEVGPDGTQKLAFSFPANTYGYRAFKYDWDTDFFISDKDSLSFGLVPAGGSRVQSFHLTNNTSDTVEITSVHTRYSAYSLMQQLPMVIPPQISAYLSVKFQPETEGLFNDAIHLRWETEGQRIAKVIYLTGFTDSIYVRITEPVQAGDFYLSQNYPNPFNPVSRIAYSIPHRLLVKLQVFDILGNEIATLVDEEQSAGSYEVEFKGTNMASGIYFYRISAGEFTAVRKMLLLK